MHLSFDPFRLLLIALADVMNQQHGERNELTAPQRLKTVAAQVVGRS